MATAKRKASLDRRRSFGERFDLNTVSLTGPVIAVWGRNGDVFVRIQSPNLLSLPGPQSYVNIVIPGGMIDGDPVTLQKGDLLRVTGYVRQSNFQESLRLILESAGKRTFFDRTEILQEDRLAWKRIYIKRRNSIVQALKIEVLVAPAESQNFVDLEGIVSEAWLYPRDDHEDLFFRIAIYDEHTIETANEGNFGRKKRYAHYINILLPEQRPVSSPDERRISIDIKQRVRVRGELRCTWSVESVHDLLFSTGRSDIAGLLQRSGAASDELKTINTQLETLTVVANALVLYSR